MPLPFTRNFVIDTGTAGYQRLSAIGQAYPTHAGRHIWTERLCPHHVTAYTSQGRSPPSPTDCFILAFGRIRPAAVATDDLGMHLLAKDFSISVWHGHELLKKMLSAKLVENTRVREIYDALENNDDLPQSWRAAKHAAFKKIFWPAP